MLLQSVEGAERGHVFQPEFAELQGSAKAGYVRQGTVLDIQLPESRAFAQGAHIPQPNAVVESGVLQGAGAFQPPETCQLVHPKKVQEGQGLHVQAG